jgi:hypothetical protein
MTPEEQAAAEADEAAAVIAADINTLLTIAAGFIGVQCGGRRMRTGRSRVADQILNAPGGQPLPPATACDYLQLLSALQLVIADLHRQEQQQPAAAESSLHDGCMPLVDGCNLVMLHLVSKVWEVPQSRPSPQQQQAACADALLVQALAVPLELDAFSAYAAETGSSWRPGHQLHALRAAVDLGLVPSSAGE